MAGAGRLERENQVSPEFIAFLSRQHDSEKFSSGLTVPPCRASAYVSRLKHEHAWSGPIFGGVLFVLSESH